MAKLISGKELAARVKQEVAQEVQALRQKQITVRLAVIIVGENPASMTYVAGKARDCEACGIESDVIRLPEQTTEAELLERVRACNEDSSVNGLLVQECDRCHCTGKRCRRFYAGECGKNGDR